MRVTKSVIMEYFREYALPALHAMEHDGINPIFVTYQITHSSVYGGYDLRKFAPGETGYRMIIDRESPRVFLEKLCAYVLRESKEAELQHLRHAVRMAIDYLETVDEMYTLTDYLKSSLT